MVAGEVSGDVDDLLVEFELARQIEDERLRSTERVRISAWNPRVTMVWEKGRREKRVADLKRWAEQWWRERGYRVKWNDDAAPHQVPSGVAEPLI